MQQPFAKVSLADEIEIDSHFSGPFLIHNLDESHSRSFLWCDDVGHEDQRVSPEKGLRHNGNYEKQITFSERGVFMKKRGYSAPSVVPD
jgi:hypothetical protein